MPPQNETGRPPQVRFYSFPRAPCTAFQSRSLLHGRISPPSNSTREKKPTRRRVPKTNALTRGSQNDAPRDVSPFSAHRTYMPTFACANITDIRYVFTTLHIIIPRICDDNDTFYPPMFLAHTALPHESTWRA